MPNDAEMVFEEVGKLAPAESVKWCQRAVEAADESGNRLLRISSRLCLESALRGARKPGNPVRAELLALAPAGGGGDPMRAEVAARALLDGDKRRVPGDGVASHSSWPRGARSPSSRSRPMRATIPGPVAIVGWGRGRYHASRADIDQVYSGYATALGELPLHRQGALAIDTVLDGSQGIPSAQDLELLKRLQGKGSTGAALAIHEVEHRREAFRRDFRLGRDPTIGLSEEVRDGLRSAVAQVNVGHLLFLAGAGPYPREAIQNARGRGEARGDRARVLERAPAGAAGRRRAHEGARIRRGDHLVPDLERPGDRRRAQRVRKPDPRSRIRRRDHRLGGATPRRSSSPPQASSDAAEHRAGDQLRKRLLNPFAFELSGVGRYLVVAPDELLSFPFTTFPEQADGLRWLAEIRNVSSASTLSLLQDARPSAGAYDTNFLGLGSPAAPPAEGQEPPEVTVPPELVAAEHLFVGGDHLAPHRRRLHDREVEVGCRRRRSTSTSPRSRRARTGDSSSATGRSRLSDVRATPLTADLVIITAEAPYQIQLARSRAFLEAGAHRVHLHVVDDLGQVPHGVREVVLRSDLPGQDAVGRACAKRGTRSSPSSAETKRTTPASGEASSSSVHRPA